MGLNRVLACMLALSAVAVVQACGSEPRDVRSSPSPARPTLTQPPDKQPVDPVAPPRKLIRVKPGDPFAPTVVWKRDELVVTAYGSSSCPPVATGAGILGPQLLRITFQEPPAQECTADYAPRLSRIAAPTQHLDLDRKVDAVFDLEGLQRLAIRVRLVDPAIQE
jgi:hypothetical protein